MKKLILIGVAVLLVFGISTFANAQVPFPGEKVYISGTNPVGMGKADATAFTYRIDLTDANPTMVVLDVVPAEFDVTALTPTCGTATATEINKPGDKLRPDHIVWVLNGDDDITDPCTGGPASLTVEISTDSNPGHGKRGIAFFEPTSCGPLHLNDGAVMVDPVTEEATEPSNALFVAACADELQSDCMDGEPDGWSIHCGDCNDGDASINPGADEICDGVDNDCDLLIDEDYASYSCGVGACEAASVCESGAESCTPGTPSDELCSDGADNNCDGQIDEEGCLVV